MATAARLDEHERRLETLETHLGDPQSGIVSRLVRIETKMNGILFGLGALFLGGVSIVVASAEGWLHLH